MDTDVPIEQFIIRARKTTCKGTSVEKLGKTVFQSDWAQGFGLLIIRRYVSRRVIGP